MMDIYYKVLCQHTVEEIIKLEWEDMTEEEKKQYELMKESAEEVYQKQEEEVELERKQI